jgi:uncharacterized GH25 family protein/ABC-type Co2+ transport system permease subunit
MIQALVFGDGGVTAIAANCFNIALVGSLFGYVVYRLVIKAGEKLRPHGGSEDEGAGAPKKSLLALGTALGAYAGINAAALCTALELGLQPLLYGSGPGAGYFPYSLRVALPAVLIPHLTLVGVLEAVVAVLVVSFLRKGRAEIIRGINASASVMAALILLLFASSSQAHDFWIEQKGQNLAVVFGHGAQREEFDAAKIKSVRVLDSQGKEISAQKEKKDKGLFLKAAGQPAAIVAEIDNGYWSKTIYGWKELPKRKANRVVEAIRSLFYTKAIISWSEAVQSASGGARLDIAPLKNPLDLKPGDPLPLQILLGGRPLPGAEAIGPDHARLGTAGKDGIVKVPLARGFNLVTVEHKEALKDDPDADALRLTATLTFEVQR